jgi:hypothetical protein
MKKFLTKIDFTLMFRLLLSLAMVINGYKQNDNTSYIFASFLLIYAIVAAKYKVGCGYNTCSPNNKTI